ncbi:MAG: flagellar motor protein MotB, partial [Pedobacter sp.]|nr:flagellar motor protein MotB [Chitinophagaceae bacterium]
MKYLFLIAILGVSLSVIAQNYHPEKVNQKAIATYEKAIEKLRDGDIKTAIPLLENCIAIDNNYVDAYLSLAGAFGELKNYKNAITNYEVARNKDTNYF